MAEGDAVRTAALVLAFSVLLELLGALLVSNGGLLAVFGFLLVAFGVMGLVQAVAIAFGRQRPRSPSDEEGGDRH